MKQTAFCANTNASGQAKMTIKNNKQTEKN